MTPSRMEDTQIGLTRHDGTGVFSLVKASSDCSHPVLGTFVSLAATRQYTRASGLLPVHWLAGNIERWAHPRALRVVQESSSLRIVNVPWVCPGKGAGNQISPYANVLVCRTRVSHLIPNSCPQHGQRAPGQCLVVSRSPRLMMCPRVHLDVHWGEWPNWYRCVCQDHLWSAVRLDACLEDSTLARLCTCARSCQRCVVFLVLTILMFGGTLA